MQHFYDGAIRRYVTQTIRVLSEFTVRYGDGSLHRIPVNYGDADRQVANIIKQNSDNTINSAPKMSVYIYGLDLDKDRLADSTFIGKVHVNERKIQGSSYTSNNGRNYTIERLMPTPFKLTMKVDIWSANTDQKLQILEQVLMMFNPSLEIQTTDNLLDWSSLSVLNLDNVNWSSRSIPVGNDTPIDIATITLTTPIWISPPVKIKQRGIITKIVTGLFDGSSSMYSPINGFDYLDPDLKFNDTGTSLLAEVVSVVSDFSIEVYNDQITLLNPSYNIEYKSSEYDMPERIGPTVKWNELLELYPNKFIAGFSRIFVKPVNGAEFMGTLVPDVNDETIMVVTWDRDTLNSNTGIDSNGYLDTDPSMYNQYNNRPNSPGTFDAIINPLTYNPRRPNNQLDDQPLAVGLRFMLIENIGSIINEDGADAWKSNSGIDLIAHANDIIEWDGEQWTVIFDSQNEHDTMIWQTNTYTGIQFTWNGVAWTKSFEGFYRATEWRLEL